MAYVCNKQEMPEETLESVKNYYLQLTVSHYRV